MAEATGQTVVNAEIVGKKIDVKTAAPAPSEATA